MSRNFLLGRPLVFGDPLQQRAIDTMRWPTEIDERHERSVTCIRCNQQIKLSFVGREVMTPRAYSCRHCAHRILVFRADEFEEWELHPGIPHYISLGATEIIDPLQFIHHSDPYKFYLTYNLI